jgi:hypothetical protein
MYINQKGVDNGKSIAKANGDGVVSSRSGSEKKMRNPGQSYTSRERY